MLKIKKEIAVFVDGEDVQVLLNICEIARVQLHRNRSSLNYIEGIEREGEIDKFLESIFDAT